MNAQAAATAYRTGQITAPRQPPPSRERDQGTLALAHASSARVGPDGRGHNGVVRRTARTRALRYEIRHSEAGSSAGVVVASGELDAHAAPALRETLTTLTELGRIRLVIDMSDATFIDSTAIGVLVGQLRRMGELDGSLSVVCTNENVLRTFEIAGVEREFEIHPRFSEALVRRTAQRPHVHPKSSLLRAPGMLELRLPPRAAELARARGFAAAAGRRFGLDPRRRYDFALAASEAVANAIEHGAPCRDGTIEMLITERPDTLTVAVRDGGRFVLGPPPPGPLPERGRGLRLMSRLVDEISIRCPTGHTEVELSINR
jgi:anti-sigma B factor antagonist